MLRKWLIAILFVSFYVPAAVWVFSLVRPHAYFYRGYSESSSIMAVCYKGQLRLSHWMFTDPPAATYDTGERTILGFGYHASVNLTPTNKVNRMYRLMMPMWAVFGLAVIYPVRLFVRGPVTRFRRARHQQCLACGYSLVGNLSGVCPECGTAVRQSSDGELSTARLTAAERALWACYEKVTSRTALVVLLFSISGVVGVRMLLSRPWESATVRVYRICGARGLTRSEVDILTAGFRGGFAPNSPIFDAIMALHTGPKSPLSKDCMEAAESAAQQSTNTSLRPPFPRRR